MSSRPVIVETFHSKPQIWASRLSSNSQDQYIKVFIESKWANQQTESSPYHININTVKTSKHLKGFRYQWKSGCGRTELSHIIIIHYICCELLSDCQSPLKYPLINTLMCFFLGGGLQISTCFPQINRLVPKLHPTLEYDSTDVTHRSYPKCLECPSLLVLETHFHSVFWGLRPSLNEITKSPKSLMWISEASYSEL